MSWGAIIGGTIVTVGGLIASRGQERAAETQAEAAEQQGQQQLAIAREQLAATQPLRDLALAQGQLGLESQRAVLPSLQQEFKAGGALAPFFQQQQQRGTRNIISSLAPFGLADSSVAGRAVGELGANLGTQELLARRNLGTTLAGLGQVPGSFGTAGLNTAALLQQGAAQSQFGAGQSLAAGQLGSSRTLGNLFSGLGGQLSQMDFTGTGQTVGGNNALTGQDVFNRFGGQLSLGFSPN